MELCREAPLYRRGNVSYEQDDVLRELKVLMNGVMTLCRIADDLFEDIDASKRQITIREETMLAVLYRAVCDLGYEALVIDSMSSDDPEENLIEVWNLLDLRHPFTSSPTQLLGLPKDVLALDIAANMLTERIAQIRGRGIPMDEEPDPNDYEGIRAFARELLEPHCWPLLPERAPTDSDIKAGTPRWRGYRLLRRLRLPTIGELSCLGLPTLITAALLFMFWYNTVDGWLIGISLAMGFLGLYSHVGTKRERRAAIKKEFDYKRESMVVPETVIESIEDFAKRLMSAVRAGPRGMHEIFRPLEITEPMVDDWMRMHPPPRE